MVKNEKEYSSCVSDKGAAKGKRVWKKIEAMLTLIFCFLSEHTENPGILGGQEDTLGGGGGGGG